MKKRTVKPANPDRKLTAKEKKVVASLVETYVPVRERKEEPVSREKAYADLLELFN